MREIRGHPPFDIKEQIEENEGKQSVCIRKSNEGEQNSDLKLELCPFVVEI